MKILELELDLCIRLSLNNIRHFKLTLKEIVQLLLGTNGSGKSSILYELSPLPALAKDYHKGGKKRILIAAHGKTYELISDFSDGQDYYFICDGEHLNKGRLISEQRELVKEHFGYTAEVHEIMLGLEPFTQMKPPRRREVFTMLCTVDYTYSIGVYTKAQKAMRENAGAAKLAKERLVKETNKTLKDEEITQIRSRLANLNRESQAMYMLRNADAPSVGDAKSRAGTAIQSIHDLTDRFRSIRKILKDKCYFSPEEYQSDIDSAKEELAKIEGVYARLAEEFMASSIEVNSVSDLEGEDVVKLKDTMIADNKLIKELLGTRKKPLEGFNAMLASQSMFLIFETLQDVLVNIKADPENQMTSEKLNEVEEKVRLLELSLRTNIDKRTALEHQERHLVELSQADHVDCPECKHKWKVGYSEEAHLGVKLRIQRGTEVCTQLAKELADMLEKKLELVQYSQRYREYIRITRSTPELQPLWNLISEENALKESPQHALSLVELVRNDLEIELRVHAIREKIATDMKRLEMAEYAQSETIKEKKKRLDQLEREIGILSNQKILVQNKLYELTTTQRQIKQMYAYSDAIAKAKDTLNNASVDIINAAKNEIIDLALADTHHEIAILSTRMHSIDQHEALINQLKEQIRDYEKAEKAYRAISDTLSPVDGLIATGMLGFIRHFVAKMNALIAKVWVYRMEVHDCSTEEDSAELNYKFPLSTPNRPKPVEDVDKGSSAQKQMVDLAFRIIGAQSLGLDRGPLGLDEFGTGFDEGHREAATQVIGQLMEQLNFSQLFMISHYDSSYGAFYNAQITVLDKRNITIPGNRRYNEFAVLEN